VYLDDTITATVEVLALEDKGRVRLRTTCTNQAGELVLDGEAVVLPPRPKDVP
jgi:3-hydroxybutyryl-CoA dehydratase